MKILAASSLLFLFFLLTLHSLSGTKEGRDSSFFLVSSSYGKIDLDLTKMSSTMIFAQVFNMLISPETFEGKVIKMRGTFAVYPVSSSENLFAVVIQDATECCKQGLEFKKRGNPRYPFDYPPEGALIEVTGIFKMGKTKDGYDYFYIDTDSVVLLRAP